MAELEFADLEVICARLLREGQLAPDLRRDVEALRAWLIAHAPMLPEEMLARRTAAGLTLEALARQTGAALRQICRYQAGETPIPPYLAMMLRKVSTDPERARAVQHATAGIASSPQSRTAARKR